MNEKNLFYLLIVFTIITTSCKKVEVEPYYEYEVGEYDPKKDVEEYYQNETDGYTNGGTLPNGGGTISNFLEGTTWVLVSYKKQGYATTNYPNDTIVFTTSTNYTINGSTTLGGKYVLVKVPNTPAYNLTLQSFISFGSADDYSGEISDKSVDYGEIYTDFEGQWLSSNVINSAKFIKI